MKAYMYGEASANPSTLNALKDIQTIQITAAGHFSMIDNPEDFYSSLAKLLKPE